MVIALALILPLMLLGVWIGFTYNKLISLRLRCESSWAQIDVALKLRHDLIPRLAEAVAGYAGHESSTLTEVASARGEAVQANKEAPAARGTAEGSLGGSLGRMLILAEDYPELKATENFAQLQTQLAEVEEKISITRRVYNDVVERYNTATQVFPPVIVAKLFRFRAREFFEAGPGAEIAPRIEIDGGAD